jgi:NAD(P)-dependent dehydrogenase (short-subunit alcohol dehydrogenase family)
MEAEAKVVAITGVASGIGRALAKAFAEGGARVVGCDIQADKGARVERAIRDAGGRCTFVEADVTREDDCQRFIDAVVTEHGRIDVLINNAGGSGRWMPSAQVDEAAFDAVLRLNLYGPHFCARRAIHYMIPAGGGLILSLASIQGIRAVAGSIAYNAAKAALIQMSNTLAVEYQHDNIRSNIIMIGGAPTGGAAAVVDDISRWLNGKDADFGQDLPRSLTGTPLTDIASAAVLLASDGARAITGATIAIDQGMSAGALHSDAVFLALSGGWKSTGT